MEIVTRNIVQYLIKRRLVTQEALVDGGLVLSMQRSRNRFIWVKQKPGRPSYFIKQALATEAMSATTVAREAAIYQGAFGDERLTPLKALLPRFHHFDADDAVLITELVDQSEHLAVKPAQTGSCRPALAGKLGAAIASYHQIRFVPDRPQAAVFPQEPPWMLFLHTRPRNANLERSPACSAIIDMLVAAPGLAAHFADLRATWARDTLIHCDLKWENCLLSPIDAPLEQQKLHIIDWELADIGDAAWDVGSIFQSYLNLWITSMNPVPGATLDAIGGTASVDIDTVQQAIPVFWDSYAATSEHVRVGGRQFMVHCVRMMAARMCISAFEGSAKSATVDLRALLMVQMALNVLDNPVQAIRTLLALGERYDQAA
jgi:hypothetical protein